MAGTTVLRQALKLGAGCGNSACPDLPGGRGVTLVPTGIKSKFEYVPLSPKEIAGLVIICYIPAVYP